MCSAGFVTCYSASNTYIEIDNDDSCIVSKYVFKGRLLLSMFN